MKKCLWLSAMLAVGLVVCSCGGGGGGGSDDDDTLVAESGSTGGSGSGNENTGGSGSGIAPAPAGFVTVAGGTVTGGNQFTLTGQTADYYKGVFIAGRTVTISPFYICDHEVTQAEYEAYCTYTGSNSPSSTYGDGNNYPAYYVSWYDALVYCNKRSMAENLEPCYSIGGKTNPDEWGTVPTSSDSTWNNVSWNHSANGYRLPTEAEWEYAARGGASGCSAENPTDYAGTENESSLGTYAWYYSNSGDKTHEVKKKEANALGLFDMSGNVWEWCWDWYGTLSAGSSTNPAGAASGSYRVGRGGGWYGGAVICSVAYRLDNYPYCRDNSIGFRVVRSAQ